MGGVDDRAVSPRVLNFAESVVTDRPCCVCLFSSVCDVTFNALRLVLFVDRVYKLNKHFPSSHSFTGVQWFNDSAPTIRKSMCRPIRLYKREVSI
jgi:hypothetical protein